jgi:hypothetical protein
MGDRFLPNEAELVRLRAYQRECLAYDGPDKAGANMGMQDAFGEEILILLEMADCGVGLKGEQCNQDQPES